MQLSKEQLRTLQSALWDSMDKNFEVSSEAIDNSQWDYLEYKRKQRDEMKELLEVIREELTK